MFPLYLFFKFIFFNCFSTFNRLKNYIKDINNRAVPRSLFFMIIVLSLFIFFVKKKRDINFEIYQEKKELVKCIIFKLYFKYRLTSVFLTSNKFIIHAIVKYKFVVCEREKLPVHYHQIGEYIIIPLKFPSVKKEMFNVKKDKIFSRVKSGIKKSKTL